MSGMDTKRIKCPKCKKILEVTNKKKESIVLVGCPQCGAKIRVKFDTGETMLAGAEEHSDIIGALKVASNSYPLHEGVNIVGRKTQQSKVDIPVETDDLAMSRKHASIEVVRLKSGRVKVVLSDMRSAEKATFKPIIHEDIPLDVNDRVVICFGDTIQLGNTKVKYVRGVHE